jgi:hypothetical protein
MALVMFVLACLPHCKRDALWMIKPSELSRSAVGQPTHQPGSDDKEVTLKSCGSDSARVAVETVRNLWHTSPVGVKIVSALVLLSFALSVAGLGSADWAHVRTQRGNWDDQTVYSFRFGIAKTCIPDRFTSKEICIVCA